MIIDLSNFHLTIQESYRPIFWNKSRFCVLVGGAGAGKSVAIASKLVYRSLSEPGSFHVVIRKTANTHRYSTFPLILQTIEKLGMTSFCRINKSDLSIEFIHPFNSKIIFLGMDSQEKIKSLIDMGMIFIEEASELTLNDFNQINLRLRGNTSTYLQLCASSNPVGGVNSWINQMFFKNKHPQASVFTCNVYNNQYIDPDYIKTLEIQAAQNPEYGKIYLEGVWANPEGIIFTNWTTINSDTFPKRFDWFTYGVDWGYNDPTTVIKVGCKDQDLFIKQELYQTHLTTDEIISIMKTDIIKNMKLDEIYCDSAEPDRIQAMKTAGFNNVHGAKKGPNSIKLGIDTLKSRKLYIDENSTHVINEFSTYSWKKNSNNEPMDVPIDTFNHTIDAIRYAVSAKLGSNSFDPNKPLVISNINVRPR